MMRRMSFIFIGALIVLTAGCTPTPPPFAPIQVEILDPLDGAALPLGEPYLIRFQAISHNGIDQFEVSVPQTGWNTIVVGPFQTGSGSGSGTRFYGEATWTPNQAGDYTIMVRATNQYQMSTPYAEVHVTVGEYVQALVTAVLTPEVIEVGPSPTPTVVIIHNASAVKNANCRAGPGTAHNETGFVPKGSTVEVVGRNEDGTWLKVVNPNGAGFCWVSMIAFEIKSDVELVPVDAAVPTAPPPADPEEAEPTGCTVTSPLNNQTRCVSPCPAGAVPGTACTP